MSPTIIEKLLNGAEVEWKPLGEIVKIADNARRPIKAELRKAGATPYYGANNIQDYVQGYTHEGEYVLVAEDGSKSLVDYSVQWACGCFWANNHVHVIQGNDKVNNRFLFYALKNMNFLAFLSGGTRAKLTKAKLVNIPIPIPPVSVQQEIVRILDAFTAHTAELTVELTAELNERKKQYNYYLNKLLTFSDDEVEWKTVEEIITTVTPPLKIPRGKYNLSGNIPIVDQGENFIAGYTDNADAALPANEYIIFGDHTEYIKYVDFSFAQGADGLKILKPNRDLAKYVYYAFLNFYNKTGNYKRHWTDAKKILLPIVSIKAQKRIVSILDKFDALTTSISEGLPREIELRNKQYEYYRDQLLNFSKPDLEN